MLICDDIPLVGNELSNSDFTSQMEGQDFQSSFACVSLDVIYKDISNATLREHSLKYIKIS